MIQILRIINISLFVLATAATAQEHIEHLDAAFGIDSTEWESSERMYYVSRTQPAADSEAVRLLARLMNEEHITPGTTVQLNSRSGNPLAKGIKDAFGHVRVEWLVEREPPAPVAPRSTPPRRPAGNTWGTECTSYQTGNTTGVRCRDSSGNTWGSECTSYQHGNTSGVRCREW